MIRKQIASIALIACATGFATVFLSTSRASASGMSFTVTDLGSLEDNGILTKDPTQYQPWRQVSHSSYPSITYGNSARISDKTSSGASMLLVDGAAPYNSIHTFINVNPGANDYGFGVHTYDVGLLPGMNETIASDWIPGRFMVGTATISSGSRKFDGDASFRAFMFYDHIEDLNSLIPQDSGWLLKSAVSVRPGMQILGWGTNPAGQTHAFLLTPQAVPEPSTFVLFGGALATLCFRKRASRFSFKMRSAVA